MALIGEHWMPTWAVTSWTTTPRRPRRVATLASSAERRSSQQVIGPVLQLPEPCGTGVAAARAVKTAAVRRASLANMAVECGLGGGRC